MRHAALKPDLIFYSAAISERENGAEWTLPLELLAEMLHWNLEPSVICYNGAISACEKGQKCGMPMCPRRTQSGCDPSSFLTRCSSGI